MLNNYSIEHFYESTHFYNRPFSILSQDANIILIINGLINTRIKIDIYLEINSIPISKIDNAKAVIVIELDIRNP